MSQLRSPPHMLDEEEEKAGQEIGLILSKGNGKRTISGAYFSPPSSTTASLSFNSSGASASIRYSNFHMVNREWPEDIQSVAGLQFVGFNEQTAQTILRRYSSRPDPDDMPFDLRDFIFSHLGLVNSPTFRDFSPAQAMTRLGIKTSIQEAILHPQYADLFGTASLFQWLRQTLGTNYSALLFHVERVKSICAVTVAKKRGKRRNTAQSLFEPQSEASASSSSVIPTVMLSWESSSSHFPSPHVAIRTEDVSTLPEHAVLWCSSTAVNLQNATSWISEDGSFNMASIAYNAPGDFNYVPPAWYFTPQKETAEKYRQWHAIKNPETETWLIRIQVPHAFLKSLQIEDIWFDNDFKEFVWHCRNGSKPPAKFENLYPNADVICGPIASGGHNEYRNMPKDQILTRFREEMLVRISSGKAQQVVLMKLEVAERLGEAVRGKTDIEIFGPTDTPSSSSK
jgi:hypothetical protein